MKKDENMKKNNVLLYLSLVSVLALVGCDNSAKREAADLRSRLDALSSKNQSLIEEKAKADAEVIKGQAELTAAKERVADAKVEAGGLRGEMEKLKNALSSAENRASRAEELLQLAKNADISNREAASRREAELVAELENWRKKQEDKKGTVSGVVTYFFNNNFGYRPDVGASVMIARKADYPEINFDLLPKFMLAKSLYSLMMMEKKLNSRNSVGKESLEKQGIHSDEDWEKAVSEVQKVWDSIEYSRQTINLNVDGNGTFKRSLAPGEYWVLIRSKQRQGSNSLELLGKVHAALIKIEADGEVSVSAKFEAY